ncbi:protein DEEPER ROOTING 1-like [Amaranthus tricolor]|uniref:protein DEEPER ROOTING 1-like n=1 Tax=Amaranthus tricolor TaxID=29722 RepID=UPI00258FAB39|nr:protein DEEPER ROOTING 1-like [Amaranthus tricolor]XP_057535626.1 protein DEEPER ROOTING 1-like [Amaranthus tricolor]
MQNKFNGRPGNEKTNTVAFKDLPKQPSQREEFNDWPHGLLTIGTFGNKELKDKAVSSEIQTAIYGQEQEQNPTSVSSPDLSEFTPEEVGQLQNELTKLLKRKPAKQEEENPDLPLDRFLNCPSSLEVSRRISNVTCTDPDYKEDDIERTISVIIGKCKEVRAEKTKNAIGKKSLSFLLKKMFVCANGFAPAPSLRDTLQESRMEKLLRTILHKKMYPKTSSRTTSMKRYLEDKHIHEKKNNDEEKDKPRSSEACKWDKTDSEYIVLEI